MVARDVKGCPRAADGLESPRRADPISAHRAFGSRHRSGPSPADGPPRRRFTPSSGALTQVSDHPRSYLTRLCCVALDHPTDSSFCGHRPHLGFGKVEGSHQGRDDANGNGFVGPRGRSTPIWFDLVVDPIPKHRGGDVELVSQDVGAKAGTVTRTVDRVADPQPLMSDDREAGAD